MSPPAGETSTHTATHRKHAIKKKLTNTKTDTKEIDTKGCRGQGILMHTNEK